MFLLLAPPGPATGAGTGDFDEVPLDVASGVFGRRLPFDVPFVVTGRAPAGTTRVEVRFEEKGANPAPSAPLVSGVDADGPFRGRRRSPGGARLPLRVSLDVRAAAPGHGSVGLPLGRRGRAASGSRSSRGDGLAAARAAATASALVTAYEQSLNQGQVVTTPRGEVRIESRGPLLDSRSTEKARAQELARLADGVSRAQAERRAALERYAETAPSLLRELEAVAAASSLLRLVEALEARPESDPRNPRSAVFLPPASRRLVSAGAAELAALAEGRTPRTGRRWDCAMPPRRKRPTRSASGTGRPRRTCRACASGSRGCEPPGRSRPGTSSRSRRWPVTTEARSAAPSSGHRRYRSMPTRSRRPSPRASEPWPGRRTRSSQAETAVLRETLVTDSVSSEGGVYVSLDLGVLYPPELERATLTVGANVYFAPVNKRAPLRANGMRQRLALTFGLTVTNMRREEETRWENLLGEKANLFVGLGFRLYALPAPRRGLRPVSRRTTSTPSSTSAAWRSRPTSRCRSTWTSWAPSRGGDAGDSAPRGRKGARRGRVPGVDPRLRRPRRSAGARTRCWA